MMIFQHTDVRIPNSNGMLCSYNKLVGVAWMLVIVDDVGNEDGENVHLFYLELEVSYGHDVVHGLQRIDDVQLVVEGVLFEVAEANFFREIE